VTATTLEKKSARAASARTGRQGAAMRIGRAAQHTVVAVALGVAAALPAAELGRSYAPPGERASAAPAPTAEQRAAAAAEAFYARFAADLRTMDAAQKARLRADFTTRRDAARQRGAADEARHYQRLLDILDPPAAAGRRP
jgi:hypothetical protein